MLSNTCRAALLMLSLFTACGEAPDPTPAHQPKRTPQAAPVAATVVPTTVPAVSEEALKLPPRRQYDHRGRIASTYDRFKDHWATVLVDETVIDSPTPKGAYDTRSRPFIYKARFGIVRPGKTPPPLKPSDTILFVLETSSTEWQFLGRSELTLLCGDGHRQTFKVSHDGKVESSSWLREDLYTEIALTDAVRLSECDSVDGKVGRFEFSFTRAGLEAFRDFLARLSDLPTESAAPVSPPPATTNASMPTTETAGPCAGKSIIGYVTSADGSKQVPICGSPRPR
jgi:hypothetical protein